MCFYGRFNKTACDHQWETWVPCADTKSLLDKKGKEKIAFPLKLCKNLEGSSYNFGWEKATNIDIPGTLVSQQFPNIWCPKCHIDDTELNHGWICCVCAHQNTKAQVYCQNIDCYAQRIHGSSRSDLATSHVLCKGCVPGKGKDFHGDNDSRNASLKDTRKASRNVSRKKGFKDSRGKGRIRRKDGWDSKKKVFRVGSLIM